MTLPRNGAPGMISEHFKVILAQSVSWSCQLVSQLVSQLTNRANITLKCSDIIPGAPFLGRVIDYL